MSQIINAIKRFFYGEDCNNDSGVGICCEKREGGCKKSKGNVNGDAISYEELLRIIDENQEGLCGLKLEEIANYAGVKNYNPYENYNTVDYIYRTFLCTIVSAKEKDLIRVISNEYIVINYKHPKIWKYIKDIEN